VSIEVEILAPAATEETVAEFRAIAGALGAVVERLREDAGIPEVAVTTILADDLGREIAKRAPNGEAFVAERLVGSEVVAKTIRTSANGSSSDIVFDARYWVGDGAEAQAVRIRLFAHELTHTLMNRAAAVAGARRGQPAHPTTDDIAFELGSIIADEYRADRIAEFVLGQFVKVGEGDSQQPYRSWETEGEGYVDIVRSALKTADVEWPAIVDRSVGQEIEPATAWMLVASKVQDVLISLMHAQAFADHAEAGVDVLSRPDLISLPAADDLRGPVATFLAALRETPLIVALVDVKATDDRLESIGAEMIHHILEPIGLRTIRDGRGSGMIVVGRTS
jgi:hypothetical protein